MFLADRIVVFSQRPARIVSEIDVAGAFGPERSLALRDEERFFRMKTDLLHLVRRTAGSGAMKPDFSGQTVLVTGASRGIGLGIARAFAAAGADLHMLADDPAVEPAAIELGAKGHIADITDEAALASVFRRIPKLDILVNNAGLERLTPVDDDSAENVECSGA